MLPVCWQGEARGLWDPLVGLTRPREKQKGMRVSGAEPEPPTSPPGAPHASPGGGQSEASTVPQGTTGDRQAGLAQVTLPIGRMRPETPTASWGEAFEDPFALSPVRHVSQGGRAVPQASEDDAVVQTVGLALPELHDVRLQDVAPPGRETQGFRGAPPAGSALPAAPRHSPVRRLRHCRLPVPLLQLRVLLP